MKKRVLIFIVAYNAGNHIRQVLDRLPKEIFNHPEYHVLVIDDCSKDKTANTASAHVSRFQYENVSVLRNTINQGYGGNQKIGYRYAIENGFDLVVLLHGDGQYAPELILEFVKTWEQKNADVILGSRMMDKTQARRGGMPLYKWLGNQILTKSQNFVVGSALSEFHTGYRAYSTCFLKNIPFELNTNDFHFDTEILLQAMALRAKITEFPIPTHYGDEVCHVNGLKYAKDAMKACLKYKSQKVGFFCSMQYRGLLERTESENSEDPIHAYVLNAIQAPAKVLELGHQVSFISRKLKGLGCQITQLSLGDEDIKENISDYQYVLALDAMERTSNPERLLVELRYSAKGLALPNFLFSSGNVSFLFLRILLSLGFFNYGERGILKVSNKRLFTLSSFHRMLRETGFSPKKVVGVGIPFQLLFPGAFGGFMQWLSNVMARLWPSLFAYRFIVEAIPNPHSLMLLSAAERYYGLPENQLASVGVNQSGLESLN